jgi:hypothetical protein
MLSVTLKTTILEGSVQKKNILCYVHSFIFIFITKGNVLFGKALATPAESLIRPNPFGYSRMSIML